MKAGTHLSNVHQIEAGHQEPRILVAMRLVGACGVDLGSFFTKLAEEMNLPTQFRQTEPVLSETVKEDALYCPWPSLEIFGYGDLLRYCRTRKGLTQKVIIDKFHYDIRSLQRVEKGEQEPMVTTAMKLVAAIEVPPGEFFACLWSFLSRIG